LWQAVHQQLAAVYLTWQLPAIEFTRDVFHAALQVNDRTCLHAAAATGNVDVLGMLLQHSNFNLVGRIGPRLSTVVPSCIVQANALPV
jgi:hypothetical protein